MFSFLFIASVLLTEGWLLYSKNRQWLDIPNARSSHVRPTPTSGGIGFCLSFMIALYMLIPDLQASRSWMVLGVGGSLLAALGMLDDFKDLGIKPRIIFQILIMAVSIWAIGELPALTLGNWQIDSALLLTAALLFMGIWQINYFNFMDGIDGLAAMQAIFVLLVLAWFDLRSGETELAIVCLALVCCVLGFLIFNFPKAMVFMGDIGSNFLGYCLFFLGLVSCVKGGINYWTYLILMSTFLVDSSTTLMGRLVKGLVWYHGHRTHAYQLLAGVFKNHAGVVLVYSAVNLCWVLPLAILSVKYPQWAMVIALVAWLPLIAAVVITRNKLVPSQA